MLIHARHARIAVSLLVGVSSLAQCALHECPVAAAEASGPSLFAPSNVPAPMPATVETVTPTPQPAPISTPAPSNPVPPSTPAPYTPPTSRTVPPATPPAIWRPAPVTAEQVAPPTRVQPMQQPGLSISEPTATSPYAAPVRPAAPSQFRRETIASPQPDPGEQIAVSPLAPAIELARAAGERLETVRDYQCILVKREHTGGKLREAESFALKVRQQPLSMYVQCLGPALPRGREILFVDGQNSGKALVHTVGMRARFVGTENIDLQSPRLLNDSRHTLSDYAMHAFVAAL